MSDQASSTLPVGTVTVLLTDIEGSTRSWETDPDAMGAAVERLDRLIDDAVAAHGGARRRAQGEGDSALIAFARASDAAACALALQLAVAAEPWPTDRALRLRIGLNTGEVEVRGEGDYLGSAVNRCARIRDAAHGGQLLLSQATGDLVADHVPAGASLKDLGSHRLRDLARPERIFQLCHPELPETFPALKTLDCLPNNLPLQLTSFIGRNQEMAHIRKLLGTERLITLTGSGGCGKTRLALQVAAELLEDFGDGVWWVDLAPLQDPSLVGNEIAAALSVQENPMRTVTETLLTYLQNKKVLLLLDNCEHVVAATAATADAMLRSCPGVSVVATSREPLGVESEIAWRVPSLSLPEAASAPAIEAMSQFEAVRLFIDRALHARPNFHVDNDNAPYVADICHRLDGIPLAIELAAARVRAMGVDRIAAGLSDRFRLLTGGARSALARQQTLKASVDWSYDLLSDPERTLLQRLSIFAGSFTLEAAEAICAADGIDTYEVLDLLTHLVDRSLVQMEEGRAGARYRLLETIRQYGRDLLTAEVSVSLRDRHLAHYLAVAEEAAPKLLGGKQLEWLRDLDSDLDNLRAAIDWAQSSGAHEVALRLAIALGFFWLFESRFSEGIGRLETLLPLAGDGSLLSGRALAALSLLKEWSGDFGAAHLYGERALATGRDLADNVLIGRALYALGWVTAYANPGQMSTPFDESVEVAAAAGEDFFRIDSLVGRGVVESNRGSPHARDSLEQALTLALDNGNPYVIHLARTRLGGACIYAGDFHTARPNLDEALVIAEELGSADRVSFVLGWLSFLETVQGHFALADEYASRSVAIAWETGSALRQTHALGFLGFLQCNRGDYEQAAESLDDAIARGRAIGMQWPLNQWLAYRGWTARRMGDSTAARAHGEESLALGRQGNTAWAIIEALWILGRLARDDGEIQRADDLHHDELDLAAAAGWTTPVCPALEALAGLDAETGEHARAARLFGAADALRKVIGLPVPPMERPDRERDIALAKEGLDGPAFTSAWDEGAALSMDEAVAYARRGRGKRKRPSTGWASLTPTELSVVSLVAEGLSNAQIGDRLFVSAGTVKVHLGHVFSKLQMSSRAEVAAEATRRLSATR